MSFRRATSVKSAASGNAPRRPRRRAGTDHSAARLAGVIKLITAVASWATVFALFQVVPMALAMRSPEELEREVNRRRRADDALQRSLDELECRVVERTVELAKANATLQAEVGERQRAEGSLLESRRFLASSLDALTAHIGVLDEEGNILMVNEAWRRFSRANGHLGTDDGVGMNEPMTLRLMAKLLGGQGHVITTADSVTSAFESFEAMEFDLIVSDIGLPDGTGLDLMRKVVSLRVQIPAIALTGYGMEDDVIRSRDAGFTTHMTKPIDFAKLDAMIRQVVN